MDSRSSSSLRQCAEPDHYKKWDVLPSKLARSGYVVVVPRLIHALDPWYNDAEVQLLKDVISWMRVGWEHRATLMAGPATGAIGHSDGAVLAGRLAAETPVMAYVSLSRVWGNWDNSRQQPLLRASHSTAAGVMSSKISLTPN